MDIVHRFEWTLSIDSVDIVHGLSGHGLNGQCPWTLSTESMDFLQMGIRAIMNGYTLNCTLGLPGKANKYQHVNKKKSYQNIGL